MDRELAPCFLVAAPSLDCPEFHRTVVLLVDHREDGSLGFIVNRPTDVRFHHVLSRLGLAVPESVTVQEAPVLLGGPVSAETGWVVFDPTDGVVPSDGVLNVGGGLGVSASKEMLVHIAGGVGPSRHVMMLGYAGWGPGQLDDEIREGAWIPVDLDPCLVFDTPFEDRWRRAFAVQGIDPARVVSGVVADA